MSMLLLDKATTLYMQLLSQDNQEYLLAKQMFKTLPSKEANLSKH